MRKCYIFTKVTSFDAEVVEKILKVSTTYLLQQSKNFKLKTLTADVFIGTKLSA